MTCATGPFRRCFSPVGVVRIFSAAALLAFAGACGQGDAVGEAIFTPEVVSTAAVPQSENDQVALLADERTACAIDSYESQIHCVDGEGAVVGVFGRKGEGPGEFGSPAYLAHGEEGTVGVPIVRPSSLGCVGGHPRDARRRDFRFADDPVRREHRLRGGRAGGGVATRAVGCRVRASHLWHPGPASKYGSPASSIPPQSRSDLSGMADCAGLTKQRPNVVGGREHGRGLPGRVSLRYPVGQRSRTHGVVRHPPQ